MCITHANEAIEVTSSRLPKSVEPRHYTLRITPDLVGFTHTGEETIDVEVLKRVSSITITSAEIKISGITITDKFGKTRPGEVTYDEENEFAKFTFPGDVLPGRHKLSFTFKGEINDKMHGFYRSFYKDAEGKEHAIASTQMEPADARRAFPCFDEPAFKATFGITLVVDENLVALSNGKQISEKKLDGGKKEVSFKRTIKMATYIVAFVVGKLVESETVTANGVKIRVFHTPGKEHLVKFALDTAQKAIKRCEKYFGIKYPGDKLDLIAIPEFAFGAMENLGCMIFKETALLVDPLTATIAELMRVFEVVCHEIVHSWFGDYVTMIWWHGLWLNEAFATYVSNKIVHHYHPEWNVFEELAAGRRAGAMRTDGLLTTRAIQAPVNRASDALGMVDGITYGKGSGGLWQLEAYIGGKAFRDGIRVYLKKHALGNTENSDLWAAIGSQSRKRVADIMDSWIFQPGHPVVSVSEPHGASNGRVTLGQKRFLFGEAASATRQPLVCTTESSPDAAKANSWLIPVKLRYETAKGVKNKWVLLDEIEKSIYLGPDVKWVVANAGGSGFYRTQYASPLTGKIEVSSLSVLERFNLVNDSWSCVRAGLLTSDDYFDVIKEFSGENDPNVLGVITGSFGTLMDVLPKANRHAFRTFIRGLFNPTLTRLGWKDRHDESAQDKRVRGQVISALGLHGRDQEVQAKAKELFKMYFVDKSAVANNVAPALVWITAASGDEAQFEQFKSLYVDNNNPQEKARYLAALSTFENEELLSRALNLSLTRTIRNQDAPGLIASLLNTDIKEEAWKFVQDNWDYMVQHFAESQLIGMVSGFAALSTPELEAEVQAFLASHPVRGGAKQVAQVLENLRLNVSFREREIDRMVKRFS
jgi:puromycin-sensitive aminopeptidase